MANITNDMAVPQPEAIQKIDGIINMYQQQIEELGRLRKTLVDTMQRDKNPGLDKMMLTQPDLNRLKIVHSRALKEGKESFMFNDTELLTDYAGYMIEYLDQAFNRMPVGPHG